MKLKQWGVTLIEILLIMVILGAIFGLLFGFSLQKNEETRRARASLQMQQILNAGLSYFIANGAWPEHGTTKEINALRANGIYLPPTTATFNNPWGGGYEAETYKGMFYAYTDAKSQVNAEAIAGKLPNAFVTEDISARPFVVTPCTPESTRCYAVGAVNIPGQNLANASSVNFANLYHSGSCVPVPQCPLDKEGKAMIPQIMVVAVAVRGNFERPSGCRFDSEDHFRCDNNPVYSILSSTAWAIGPKDIGTEGTLPLCDPTNRHREVMDPDLCYAEQGRSFRVLTTGKFWRVCLAVTTPRGLIKPFRQIDQEGGTAWGQNTGSVLAVTRCVPAGEKTGSSFKVWGP